MFGSLLLVLVTGLPVVFVIGGLATLFYILLFGFQSTMALFLAAWSQTTGQLLLAIPLFLLMASVLQYSGIADKVYEMFYRWMGALKGGLAMGTEVICTIFAAITGTSGAATVSMGLIAIPSMLKRGYHKHLAIGSVAVGGVLGIVIPPSIIMIIYSLLAHVSIGRMFMGGIVPGIVCSLLYITYIGIRCWLTPNYGPSVPPEQRATWHEKIVSLRALVLPLMLIIVVLGSIYMGIATPTEASAIGAFGAFICAAVAGRLDWTLLKRTTTQTLRLTAMIFWILIAATIFSNLYIQMGAREFIGEIVLGLEVSPWVILILIQLSLFILGCVMDDYAIIMLTAPIYVPLISALGFDPLWFGILFILNMQIAYLTPPFGFNLFYLRGIVPEGITMGDIYRSVAPFILLQVIGLALVMIFPVLATWLPSTMMK
ncbi:C4-dicarboxylate TRAP transporter large permease protein DctM [subsurface metagenome]